MKYNTALVAVAAAFISVGACAPAFVTAIQPSSPCTGGEGGCIVVTTMPHTPPPTATADPTSKESGLLDPDFSHILLGPKFPILPTESVGATTTGTAKPPATTASAELDPNFAYVFKGPGFMLPPTTGSAIDWAVTTAPAQSAA
ncbi:hypothetical protein O9K51_08020 [Purpureocillium lavendulum]|uniref:Uncharacterized protein n=1 Tax=Purpureocillium lavendulum TaxID=1247861 RepID=A0AB34FM30_9HYPO|nr:hypothetical protein O9K51_08020 [Purpureocillium lavendulum]